MTLVIGPRTAEAIREAFGKLPPDVIVTVQPPARWPLDRPWPPKVTVAGKPCWQCVAGPKPENPLERYFAEHPLGPVQMAG
jgi:hypothetical protein